MILDPAKPLELTLGFSPCPNDCFIFDAIVHKRIDLEGLDFKIIMADVEELNRRAFEGSIDITKLSFHAYAHLTHEYKLLNAGSALGFGVGPLLVGKRAVDDLTEKIKEYKVAIPGRFTTANFLLSLAFPDIGEKIEMLFSEIEQSVLDGKVDAGLIIHEGRFTYAAKGLCKLIDLGEFWEGYAASPIPLGGIVIKSHLPEEVRMRVDRLIRRSVEYAFANPDVSRNFVKAHAQEMSEEVMQQHIKLYVNEYSIDLGEQGRKAVRLLFRKAEETGVVKNLNPEIFNIFS
jgi:1,4-dihydroxy-6-naphthoate synthase